jgi:hypothetical protein
MTIESDPPRLADSGAAAPGPVQNLFQSAQQDLPSEHALERMLTRLGPIAGAGAALAGDAVLAGAKGAATHAASTTVGASVAKLVAVIAGAGLIAGGAAMLASNSGGDESPQTPAKVAPKGASPAAAPVEALPPQPQPPAPVAPELSEPPEDPAPAHAAPAKAGKSTSSAAGVKAEAALLERARSLVASNPAQALAITRDHARRFPGGLLAQEREVIAIEALRKLGQQDEANQRATRFKSAYPGSAHQRSIGSASSEK